MKNLKNWDKKTWQSSDKYISSVINFLEKRIKFYKEMKILDIGCGRGKIISSLSKKYKMNCLPLGIDIVEHKDIAKEIRFTKINVLKYLSKTKEKFDLIFLKQSIHFVKSAEIKKILVSSKKNLHPKGKIIILALHPTENHWPLFRVFKSRLIQSLKKDAIILNIIKSNFKKYKVNYFNFKVKMTKVNYLQMIKNRFTSCLLNLKTRELKNGIEEIKKNYKKRLAFHDKLICITYKKK